jgi:hypothetical protein
MSTTKKYLVGMFDDDHTLMHAVDTVRSSGITITDVYTPFPVHGLEHKMGLRPTKLHTAGFVFGATGLTTALSMITFANHFNYPTNFGGKPTFALPAWIPIIFEHTVLFASVGMVIAFYYLCNMYPGKQPAIIDPRTTDDLFAMTFEIDSADQDYIQQVSGLLKQEGAVEIFEKEI